ncbi:multiple cyclophane-containing RiPP AmcA [Streptomyces sp. NPDC059896]|uniref:multiple cyclophane-containing RiPP AmcA n=1 Tax=Streptomyces sp. NPDC059896 TaxID=3346993 RepID=UPI003665933C
MKILDRLATSDTPVVMELIATHDVPTPVVVEAAWDNWAKNPAPFDNRPTWDNWNKKK